MPRHRIHRGSSICRRCRARRRFGPEGLRRDVERVDLHVRVVVSERPSGPSTVRSDLEARAAAQSSRQGSQHQALLILEVALDHGVPQARDLPELDVLHGLGGEALGHRPGLTNHVMAELGAPVDDPAGKAADGRSEDGPVSADRLAHGLGASYGRSGVRLAHTLARFGRARVSTNTIAASSAGARVRLGITSP